MDSTARNCRNNTISPKYRLSYMLCKETRPSQFEGTREGFDVKMG